MPPHGRQIPRKREHIDRPLPSQLVLAAYGTQFGDERASVVERKAL